MLRFRNSANLTMKPLLTRVLLLVRGIKVVTTLMVRPSRRRSMVISPLVFVGLIFLTCIWNGRSSDVINLDGFLLSIKPVGENVIECRVLQMGEVDKVKLAFYNYSKEREGLNLKCLWQSEFELQGRSHYLWNHGKDRIERVYLNKNGNVAKDVFELNGKFIQKDVTIDLSEKVNEIRRVISYEDGYLILGRANVLAWSENNFPFRMEGNDFSIFDIFFGKDHFTVS